MCFFILDYPGLKIPGLDPLQRPQPIIVQSFKVTPLISASLLWTDICIYGIKTAVTQEIRYICCIDDTRLDLILLFLIEFTCSGLQLNEPVSNVIAKTIIPHLTITLNSTVDLRAGLLNVKPILGITAYLSMCATIRFLKITFTVTICQELLFISISQ